MQSKDKNDRVQFSTRFVEYLFAKRCLTAHGRDCREILSFGDGGKESAAEHEQTQNISSCIDANYYKGNSNGFGGLGRRTISEPVLVGTLRTHKDGQGFREMKGGVAPALNARARQDGSQQGVIVVPVLTPDRPTKRQNGRRFKENGDDAFTLTAQDRHGGMVADNPLAKPRIRRLTEIEAERLQGLPDDFSKFGVNEKGETVEISSTQRYKCLGNAMTVDVVEAIITEMLTKGCLR